MKKQAHPNQQGFTLVELMISLVIGLLIVLFMSSLYFNSKTSFNINDDNARLLEDGNYALNLMGRNFMQAGYGKVLTGTTIDFIGKGLTGYDDCTAAPTSTKFACVTGQPSFTISYQTDDVYNQNTGAGADCSNQDVGATTTTSAPVANSFFVAAKSGETSASLYCSGNAATSTPQPILNNVDKLVLIYGADIAGNYSAQQFYTTAAGITALPMNALNKANWDQVVSVTVCLEMHSTNNVVNGLTTYKNCGGTTTTVTDKKMHISMTRIFTLRNRATPSLVAI